MSYTETGMYKFKEEHMLQHSREDKEILQAATEAIEYASPGRNYNNLQLTLIDMGFLKTRGIALDDQVELDLNDPKPSKTELHQGQWSRILNSAWSFIPSGEKK